MIKGSCLGLSRSIHIGRTDIRGPYFKDYFNQPSRAQIGTMVAILEVGAFCIPPSFQLMIVSSLAVGRIGDIIGRRRTIWYGALIFVVGGVFQTCAWGMPVMIIGRVISGVGVGLLSYFPCMYALTSEPSFLSTSPRFHLLIIAEN
jgi:MFS family permease